jgi:phage baseplate assembly protein W
MAGLYDPTSDIWPDLKLGRIVLAPVRVGVDRRTGKILVGWDHVVQSVFVIFLTRFHERVLRRWVGSFVPHLLGESATPRVITRFFWAIATSLELWEPNYRIKRVRVEERPDGSGLTSAEELRIGTLTHRTEGVYRPRGHLGDFTPERRRTIGLVQRGQHWQAAA